ncbi:MAG: hypothetical protein KBC57_04185 [Neisseriaceae bacterium]|nr:hypothetical protein [Neisseriaceae bacterium]
MPVAPPLPMSLQVIMADKATLWAAMQQKYDLVDLPYAAVSSWAFADAVMSWDYDMFGDNNKAHLAGFHEFVDTPTMFFRLFDDYRQRRLIP